jgi:tRNA G18 (ribose-2'-O)-methylase SpoU
MVVLVIGPEGQGLKSHLKQKEQYLTHLFSSHSHLLP